MSITLEVSQWVSPQVAQDEGFIQSCVAHVEAGLDPRDLAYLDAWPLGKPRPQPTTFNGVSID